MIPSYIDYLALELFSYLDIRVYVHRAIKEAI